MSLGDHKRAVFLLVSLFNRESGGLLFGFPLKPQKKRTIAMKEAAPSKNNTPTTSGNTWPGQWPGAPADGMQPRRVPPLPVFYDGHLAKRTRFDLGKSRRGFPDTGFPIHSLFGGVKHHLCADEFPLGGNMGKLENVENPRPIKVISLHADLQGNHRVARATLSPQNVSTRTGSPPKEGSCPTLGLGVV